MPQSCRPCSRRAFPEPARRIEGSEAAAKAASKFGQARERLQSAAELVPSRKAASELIAEVTALEQATLKALDVRKSG